VEALWCYALGHAAKRLNGIVMPEVVTTGVYRHLYEGAARLRAEPWAPGDGVYAGDGLVAGHVKGRRGTLAVLKAGLEVWEARSAMVDVLTVIAAPTQATMDVALVAASLTRLSLVNTIASLNALAAPAADVCRFDACVVRLAPYSEAVPLASAHALPVQALTVTVQNHLQAEDTSPRSPVSVEEPERAHPPTITLTLTVAGTDAAAVVDWVEAGTRLMADIVWTGPVIPGTATPMTLSLYFGTLMAEAAPLVVAGPGRVDVECAFQAFPPPARPAGFPVSSGLAPLLVELRNSRNVHPLVEG
jgi:hypothetical protein